MAFFRPNQKLLGNLSCDMYGLQLRMMRIHSNYKMLRRSSHKQLAEGDMCLPYCDYRNHRTKLNEMPRKCALSYGILQHLTELFTAIRNASAMHILRFHDAGFDSSLCNTSLFTSAEATMP